jgi:hypothetical protein
MSTLLVIEVGHLRTKSRPATCCQVRGIFGCLHNEPRDTTVIAAVAGTISCHTSRLFDTLHSNHSLTMWHSSEYDLRESEAGALPQDKFRELQASQAFASNEERICVRQQMLICAKSQRDLYPIEGFVGRTDPCILAEAHIQLAEAYRSVPGHLLQA